jgi:dienelactone hydrolase
MLAMRRLGRSVCPAALWLALAVLAPAVLHAQTELHADVREAVIRVPASATDAFGKVTSGELVVTTFRPSGDGPFPLVIISHGRDSDTRAQMQRPRYESAARYFVRKGFAVAVPLRLGYGELAALGDPEDSMGCDNPRYEAAGMAAARQVVAVAQHLQAMPDIDKGRLVLVGQSVGGFTTVAANSLRPAGLVVAINFAGGHGGNPRTRPGNPCQGQLITRAMTQWGSSAAAPMLWVYTENDRYFNPTHSKAWFETWQQAGGKGEFLLMSSFGEDGHQLFARGADLWQPVVETFLAKRGFETPGRLARPPASQFAPLADTPAPSAPAPTAAAEYRKYLDAAPPKAWAARLGGGFGWATGDDALSRALAFCQRRSGLACKLYAVDSDVVWVP